MMVFCLADTKTRDCHFRSSWILMAMKLQTEPVYGTDCSQTQQKWARRDRYLSIRLVRANLRLFLLLLSLPFAILEARPIHRNQRTITKQPSISMETLRLPVSPAVGMVTGNGQCCTCSHRKDTSLWIIFPTGSQKLEFSELTKLSKLSVNKVSIPFCKRNFYWSQLIKAQTEI